MLVLTLTRYIKQHDFNVQELQYIYIYTTSKTPQSTILTVVPLTMQLFSSTLRVRPVLIRLQTNILATYSYQLPVHNLQKVVPGV